MSNDTTPDENDPTVAAIYCRVSTGDQDTSSQQEVCVNYVEDHDTIDDWKVFDDVLTGHDDEREDYVRLKEAVEAGEFDYFVCTEFSRISRNDDEIMRFISTCFEQEMGIEILQNAFRADPDDDPITQQVNKMLASILAGMATMENLQKIDRIKRGIKYARENKGKFTHRSPAGFRIEDGYIRVVEEDFLAIREALLDHHFNGTSWSSLEEFTPVSRSALSKIYNDDERRRLYVHAEGYDPWGRDDEALEVAGMKQHVESMGDAPDAIDPEQERKQRKQWNRVGDDERAMMRTMKDIAEQARDADEPLSEEELLELYERNRNAVAERAEGDD